MTYAGVSEERFKNFVMLYQELCSKSPLLYITLGSAMFGQAGLIWALLERQGLRGPLWSIIGMIAGGVPFFVYFLITFCKLPPPMRPQTFRRVILFIICWYAGSMAIFLALGIAGVIPHSFRNATVIPFWICAAIGSASLPVLHHYGKALLRQETAV